MRLLKDTFRPSIMRGRMVNAVRNIDKIICLFSHIKELVTPINIGIKVKVKRHEINKRLQELT